MGLTHMKSCHFIMPILGLVILAALSAADTNVTFMGFLQLDHLAWAQTSEIFPNSTVPGVPGNKSLIPGIHVMSLVSGVKSTWLIISSDNELSVNIRYDGTGNLTAPTVSLLATALKTTSSDPQVPGATFERLTGANITQAGWTSPVTVPIRVEGTSSLYDADLIVVMIVPYTGLPLTNSSISALNQTNVG
jgi:hypothetical protein